MATYQQWSGHDNFRGGRGDRYRVDQITALSARAAELEEAMQEALIKMSVKAVVNRRPQLCVICGDEGHSYEYCPLAEWDEESEQDNYLSNYNCNFYNNAPFNNSNNHTFQSDLPEPYIDPAVSDFIHEQGKMNQMILEQMRAMNATLAAQNKVLAMQISHQATSGQPPHSKEFVMPTDLTTDYTDRVESTRTVQTPPVAETEHPDHMEPTRPIETAEHTNCEDSTRTVQLPAEEPEHTASADSTRTAETTENTDRAHPTRIVQKEADNLGELTHGSHASCIDRALQPKKLESGEHGEHKADTGEEHGPDKSYTDRAKAQTKQLTPKLEPLLANLRYDFLDPNKSFLLIISADLKPDRTATLLEKLKAHTGAIGCSITNSKEILWSLLMQEFDRVVRVPQKWVLPPVPPDPPSTNQ